MPVGKGTIVSISRRYKLNIRSSTKSELVRMTNVLGVIILCKYFIEARRYTIYSILLFQDNKSLIL